LGAARLLSVTSGSRSKIPGMSHSARLTAVCVFALFACEAQNRGEVRREKLSVDYDSRTQTAGRSKEERREAERLEAEGRRIETERQGSELEASLVRAESNAERAAGEPREAFEF